MRYHRHLCSHIRAWVSEFRVDGCARRGPGEVFMSAHDGRTSEATKDEAHKNLS